MYLLIYVCVHSYTYIHTGIYIYIYINTRIHRLIGTYILNRVSRVRLYKRFIFCLGKKEEEGKAN
jgi:hypothetical protein